MLLKKVTLAALAGTVLLAAAPAFADQDRRDHQQFRGNQFQGNHFRGDQFRGGHFHRQAVVVHRPVVVQRPAYGYYGYPAHDILGGLILGTVIGVAIANHNSY